MFTMSSAWERFFFVFSYIVQGSSYLSPFAYGVMHRMHHAHADTEKDPHSPAHDGNIPAMLLRTRRIFEELEVANFGKEGVDGGPYHGNLPQWKPLDRWASSLPSRMLWMLVYAAIYWAIAPSLWYLVLLPINVLMTPLQGVMGNWYGHTVGYINYHLRDTSRNLFPVDLLLLGEGLHNNHHRFAGRPDFSVRWYEFDPAWPFIWLFDRVGIIRLPLLKKGRALPA
jgi:stearoyl-CoA desaturase (Delta-9 desaturase)